MNPPSCIQTKLHFQLLGKTYVKLRFPGKTYPKDLKRFKQLSIMDIYVHSHNNYCFMTFIKYVSVILLTKIISHE